MLHEEVVSITRLLSMTPGTDGKRRGGFTIGLHKSVHQNTYF